MRALDVDHPKGTVQHGACLQAVRSPLPAALLLALAACAPTPRAPDPQSAFPVLWCQGTLRNASGQPAWTPHGRYLVELLPDGSVRAAEGGRVSGFPEKGALSLVATARVEIHLGTIDGPIVASASTGTTLPIVTYGPDVTEIALPDELQSDPSEKLLVDTSGLGLEAHPGELTPDPLEPLVARLRAPIHAAPGGPRFATTDCHAPVHLEGEARDPETGQRWLRVSVVRRTQHDAEKWSRLSLTGWIEESSLLAPTECAPVTVHLSSRSQIDSARRLLPAGFTPRTTTTPPSIESGSSIFWLTDTPAGMACFEATRNESRLELRDSQGEVTVITSYAYNINSGQVRLHGPDIYAAADHGRATPTYETGFTCSPAYTPVGDIAEGTLLLTDAEQPEIPWFLWAYRTSDAETWYRNAAACETAQHQRGPSTAAWHTAPLRGLGRPHRGCTLP